jgi:hypothetical protein
MDLEQGQKIVDDFLTREVCKEEYNGTDDDGEDLALIEFQHVFPRDGKLDILFLVARESMLDDPNTVVLRDRLLAALESAHPEVFALGVTHELMADDR